MKPKVEDIIKNISESELKEASAETLSAMGGVLNDLYHAHPAAAEQLGRVRQEVFRRLWEAKDTDERHRWFMVYDQIHVNDEYSVFVDSMEAYDQFDAYAEEYEQWKRTHVQEQPQLSEPTVIDAPQHHGDPSLLPRLSQADSEAMRALRLWCYTWILEKDLSQDYSVQTNTAVRDFAAQAKDRLWSWLQAKYKNQVAIPVEQEAEVLLTLCCVNDLSRLSPEDMLSLVERSYDYLFDHLPEGPLRTHLQAHIAAYNDDPALLSDIHSHLASLPPSALTPEDHSLLEFLALVYC